MTSSLNTIRLNPLEKETPTLKGEKKDNSGDGGGCKFNVNELFAKACLAILLFFIFFQKLNE